MEKVTDWFDKLKISARLRVRLRSQFTPHRDGYMRWYAGEPRFVCGKKTPPDEVEDRWAAKKTLIDAEADRAAPAGVRTYRTVLSEYLAIEKNRIGAPTFPIAARTYANKVKSLNRFGSFEVHGRKIADLDVREVGPEQFTAYAGDQFKGKKASGVDSEICLIAGLFNWAAGMEYIDRFRPGPNFRRPAKAQMRDERIDLRKCFTPTDIAKLASKASGTLRLMILFAAACAMTNSEVANLKWEVVNLKEKLIDFRRRKTGKVRRVCPVPDYLVRELKKHNRPTPASADFETHVFLSELGTPYDTCSTTISLLFRRVMDDAGMKLGTGRNFTGLRTTFFNLAPRGEYELERKIIMGRAQGTVDLDSYLEDVGVDRLRHVASHVWLPIQSEIHTLSKPRPGEAALESA